MFPANFESGTRLDIVTAVFENGMSFLRPLLASDLLEICSDKGIFRLIFAPRNHGRRDHRSRAHKFLIRPDSEDFVHFIVGIFRNTKRHIEIYVIDGYQIRFPGSSTTDIDTELRSAAGCLAQLQELAVEWCNSYETVDKGETRIKLRTRADYLRLGIHDEIDEDELERWRIAEAELVAQTQQEEWEAMRQSIQAEEGEMWEGVEGYRDCRDEAYQTIRLDFHSPKLPSSTERHFESDISDTDATIHRWDAEVTDMIYDMEVEKAVRLYMETEEAYSEVMTEGVGPTTDIMRSMDGSSG
jgi:hypothetical protein